MARHLQIESNSRTNIYLNKVAFWGIVQSSDEGNKKMQHTQGRKFQNAPSAENMNDKNW